VNTGKEIGRLSGLIKARTAAGQPCVEECASLDRLATALQSLDRDSVNDFDPQNPKVVEPVPVPDIGPGPFPGQPGQPAVAVPGTEGKTFPG
jgi:hypothetical protein